MTDAMAAIAILSDIDCPERLQALAHFEERWQGDLLVMDKWFTIRPCRRCPIRSSGSTS